MPFVKKISGVLQIFLKAKKKKLSGVLQIKMNAEEEKNIWSTPDLKKCIEEKNIWCTPEHASGVDILPSTINVFRLGPYSVQSIDSNTF